MGVEYRYATVKRIISKLLDKNLIISEGKGRGTKYLIGPAYEMFYPIDMDIYFKKEIDDRTIKETFNLALISKVLNNVKLFTDDEADQLVILQNTHTENISKLSESARHPNREFDMVIR